jgi:uncharacterized phage protein (predicted DNA packaging)
MKYLTFEQIKAQLRLDDQQAEDEHDLLELYGDAAEDMVLNTCNRTITDIFEQYGTVPKALVQAALMLVAQSYQHREPASPQNLSAVPYTFDLLLKPYMRLTTSSAINNNNEYGRHCNL